jgi:hypothetical protein
MKDNSMTEALKDFWPLIIAGTTAVVWLVRMEAKMFGNGREIQMLKEQRDEDRQAARESRDDVKAQLSALAQGVNDIKQFLMTERRD